MPPKARVLTDDELAQVEALASVLSTEQIADYFGIGRTTFYQIMERQDDVSVRYKRGRAKAVGTVAKGLLQKAQSGDNVAMMFYLKTQAGWRENNEQSNVQSEPQALNITFEVKDPVGDVKITEGKRDN